MGLAEYKRKRHFSETPEPPGRKGREKDSRQFVIQKHAARHLHYDFRLEMDGVLKSWAVPKGPSLDPDVRSLAVHVEDHPVEYGSFEGTIPKNQYGAGTVLLWDRGTWEPEGNPREAYKRGKLKFKLHGEKLSGSWTLVRMSGNAGEGGKNWLLKKNKDADARPTKKLNILEEQPDSVASGRTMDEIAQGADRIWNSNRAKKGTRSPRKRTAGAKKKKSAKESDGQRIEVASLPGAVRAPQPETFQPQLATLVREVPSSDEWIHELKFDGYRLLCFFEGKRIRLVTRRGVDWTHRFPTVVAAARKLGIKAGILDGEVVVLSEKGTSDFQALQNMLQRERDEDLVYFVFDLPFFASYDLTAVPLVQRKALLRQIVDIPAVNAVIRYSDHITGSGEPAYADACRRRLEGLMCKRATSPYQQGRSDDWVKVKCLSRQEFVIAGWTDPGGARTGFGSLLLGYFDDQQRFIYAGRVGTGFSTLSLQQIKEALHAIEQSEQPFAEPLRGALARGVHWVRPVLVAEIAFAEWTSDGRLRSPSFQGLREDKKAEDVHREHAASAPRKTRGQAAQMRAKPPAGPPNPEIVEETTDEMQDRTMTKKRIQSRTGRRRTAKSATSDPSQIAGVRLTNPERALYPEQGVTKRALAEYYVQTADWILPHLLGRPLTLVRCPRGEGGHCFYQKHLVETIPDPVRGIRVREKTGTKLYVAVDDLAGLVTLVQMSALEIHPWGSREDKLDHPDRMILDLDPGPGVPWENVVGAAKDVREILTAIGLTCFVRTTGGKGIHVVAPLARRASWDVVKGFAQAVAQFLTRHASNRYVATATKAKRQGKIYVDYLRNSRGATAIASYSSRARSGAPVATPLGWEELTTDLNPVDWNVTTVPERLKASRKDPWEGFFDIQQSITQAMTRKLGK